MKSLRIDVGSARVHTLDLDATPQRMAVVPESRMTAAPEPAAPGKSQGSAEPVAAPTAAAPEPPAPASAPAPVPAASTPAAPAAAATASAAPAARLVSTGGPLPVIPGVGLDLPLAMLAAQAAIQVTLSVIGDGRTADLSWWLSQGGGSGDVLYQLHVRATAAVSVRWTACELSTS